MLTEKINVIQRRKKHERKIWYNFHRITAIEAKKIEVLLTDFSEDILEDGIELEDGDEGLDGQHAALQVLLALQNQTHRWNIVKMYTTNPAIPFSYKGAREKKRGTWKIKKVA